MYEIITDLMEKFKKNSRLNTADKEIFEKELIIALSQNEYNAEIETLLCEGPIDITMKTLAMHLKSSDKEKSDVFLKSFINSQRIQENKGGTSGMRMVSLLYSFVIERYEQDIIMERIFMAMIWFAYKNGKEETNKKVIESLKSNILPLIKQHKHIIDLKFLEKEKTWIKTRELFLASVIEDRSSNIETVQAVYNWLNSSKKSMGKYTEEYMAKAVFKARENEEVDKSLDVNIDKESFKNNDSVNEPVLKESLGTMDYISLLAAAIISEDKVINLLKSEIDNINRKTGVFQVKLNEAIINEQRQETRIRELVFENGELTQDNKELTNKIQELNVLVTKLNKEIDNRIQFTDTVTRNREKQSEEYLNKLASKLRIDYRDFCDAKELEMTIDLGENMRSQLEAVFSILEKNGMKFK